MSTQQQALIMETILSIRRTLKRKAYDSDSDSSIDQSTNRGNKLRKRARFVRRGRLTSSLGPAAYKEVAEHAGYQRAIINRNPPLIDEDGYDIDSDDDEEQVQEAVAAAMTDNPYSSIHLERILAPLTAVTDLPSHPTFSRPFTSRALTELIDQGRDLMQKENAALWKAKPLLTRLVGDNTWAPCGLMTAADGRDALLFSDTLSFFNRPTRRIPTEMAAPPRANRAPKALENASTDSEQRTRQNVPEAQATAQSAGGTESSKESGETHADWEALQEVQKDTNGERETERGSGADGDIEKDPQINGDATQGKEKNDGAAHASPGKPNAPGDEDEEMGEASGATTRNAEFGPGSSRPTAAPALPPPNLRAATPVPEIPEPLEELFIHPLFHLPQAAHPDRDLGLPEQEAEEVRRLLLLYVQKQEEICRGTKQLYEGLLRAERYRKTVWRWAKAEAHCGPNRDMSDGEDWYDKEEWGLTEDLKKGEDEVEEDTAQTQKKTRNRK